MAVRPVVGGIAAAAVAIGAIAGCSGDGGTEGEGDNMTAALSPPPESEPSEPAAPSEPSAPPSDTADGDDDEDSEDDDVAAAADELQGTIDDLLEETPIAFESRGAKLDEDSKDTLKQIADAVSDEEDVTLEVTTAAGGSDEGAADTLSEDRLTAVVDELTANGVDEDRIDGNASGLQGDDVLHVEISVS